MTKAISSLLGVVTLIFILPLFSTLLGSFSGFMVGLFFEETIFGFLNKVGFDTSGFAMWQVGASLGFIGSFFRSSASVKS